MFTAFKKENPTIEMGERDSEGMICKDVVKTIYIPGSICFTASGPGTARKVIFDRASAIIFFQ